MKMTLSESLIDSDQAHKIREAYGSDMDTLGASRETSYFLDRIFRQQKEYAL